MPINDVKFGEKNIWWQEKLLNLYGCKFGDNCKIGNFVEIGHGVTIGNNCRIQAFSFICQGVTIEDDVFIGPHVCFTNVKKPVGGITGEIERTLVKRGAVIGANCTIICGVTIGKNAFVGAGSVVTKDVGADATVMGNPAK